MQNITFIIYHIYFGNNITDVDVILTKIICGVPDHKKKYYAIPQLLINYYSVAQSKK